MQDTYTYFGRSLSLWATQDGESCQAIPVYDVVVSVLSKFVLLLQNFANYMENFTGYLQTYVQTNGFPVTWFSFSGRFEVDYAVNR